MATAEELLAQMEENPELYADSAGPVNDVIMIDAETRTIELPESEKIFGVESDKASERKYFRCPKIVGDNIDLSTLNLFINFKNANNEGDIYHIDDVVVDGDYITFSWLLSRKVTAYKTDASKNQLLSFIFCAKSGEGPDNEWNTTLCSDGIVLEGLEPGESIVEENADIIQYILERLESSGTITPEQISVAVEEYFASNQIQTGATEEQANQIEKNRQDISKLSDEIAKQTGTGLSTEAIDKLEEVGNYLVYTTADGGSKWTELISILRNGSSGGGSGETEATLSSISATYTGGEVTTGTALSDLTGITVTATYSDGTTKTVTGYTLSGEILEGENTITVSYGGKTTTFTVTGIVESGGEATAKLPTDGLLDFFDFRTCEYNNAGSGGSTLIHPTQGNGQLYTWANNAVTEQSTDYGVKVTRSFYYDANGGTTQSECGETFTWVFKCYLTSFNSPMFTNDYASGSNINKIIYKPKYNTASSTAQVSQEGFGTRLVDAYDLLILVVNNNICKLYFENELIKEIDGNTIDGFVSWYSKLKIEILSSNGAGYFTQLAIYNKALSEVEITEMQAYLKTLEVA